MYYTMQTKSEIKVHSGDIIEVLEAFYFKYANEILVKKIRHTGIVYELSLPIHSNFDLMELKAHDAYVEGVKRSEKSITLTVSLFANEADCSDTPPRAIQDKTVKF